MQIEPDFARGPAVKFPALGAKDANRTFSIAAEKAS
jgi:hypothetical protein